MREVRKAIQDSFSKDEDAESIAAADRHAAAVLAIDVLIAWTGPEVTAGRAGLLRTGAWVSTP
jgi:hypothetical protein